MADRTDFQADMDFSARTKELVKRVIGPLYLRDAPTLLDLKQATDLVSHASATAIRCRRYGKLAEGPARTRWRIDSQWSVLWRYSRESGAKTEFAKIMSGYVDRYFYGHVNADETNFDIWYLLDVNACRRYHAEHPEQWLIQRYAWGTEAIWFDVRPLQLWYGGVIASHGVCL